MKDPHGTKQTTLTHTRQQQYITLINHIWQHGGHGGLSINYSDISAAIESYIHCHSSDVILQLLAKRTIIRSTRQSALQNVMTKYK